MRFYIATGLRNFERANELAGVLIARGHEQTHDWTVYGDVRRDGPAAMSELAFNELRAIRDAELMVVLLPGGTGTHTELGMAIATRSNKRIILWSESDAAFSYDEHTCTFYFHPCIERVVCPFEELKKRLDNEQISSDISRAMFE